MEAVRTLLEQQPLMTLFLTVAVGYLVGEISVRGLSLGVGAVLFVALAMGWFAPNAVPAPMIGTLGLAIFLYAVGIHYGRQFVIGLTSVRGLMGNLIAFAGVVVSGITTLLFARMGLGLESSLGLFAGAGTSTPTLQAAMAALGSDGAAVGYSVAYPLGIVAPILFLFLAFAVVKPRFVASGSSGVELLEISVRRPEFVGKRLTDVTALLPTGVRIVAVRRNSRNEPTHADTVLDEHDVLLVVGATTQDLEQVQMMLGQPAPGRLVQDRRDLDYIRVFASRPAVVGRRLCELQLPGDRGSVVVHVRRGDVDLQARPDLVLEFGDRVGMLANRSDFPAMRKLFGDSIKGTAEFSYISIGLGMALGFLLGAIPIPVPGIGTMALGLPGVLIVSLALGNVRRAAGLNWTIPLSANLVLRSLGLTLFLAQVGMASGPQFAATLSETGPLMLGLSAIVVSALVVPILLLALLVCRLPFDEAVGIVAGACGNPAILAYANTLAPTEKPDVGYASIFPGMTIVKILFVNLAAAFS